MSLEAVKQVTEAEELGRQKKAGSRPRQRQPSCSLRRKPLPLTTQRRYIPRRWPTQTGFAARRKDGLKKQRH